MKSFVGRCCKVRKIKGKTLQTFFISSSTSEDTEKWKSDKEKRSLLKINVHTQSRYLKFEKKKKKRHAKSAWIIALLLLRKQGLESLSAKGPCSSCAEQTGESRAEDQAPCCGSSAPGTVSSTGKQPVLKTAPKQPGPPTRARPNQEPVGFGLPLNPASYLILESNTTAPN